MNDDAVEITTYEGCVIAVTFDGYAYLVSARDELIKHFDGPLFEDNCQSAGKESLPKEPGIYLATVEYRFEQGYFEGHKADGESEWDFILKDVRRLHVEKIGWKQEH